MARDLLVHDPPRVLAWRLLHDARLAAVWLSPLLPRPPEGLDRDPVALLLGAIAVACAVLYLIAALAGARPAVRGALLAVASATLVVAPTAAFVAMGIATGRPYGQDGGVVQLPLAMDKILAGESPYGADYSDSILGKEARVSDFWAPYGGNPILHHHAYLPGTHLLVMPFYLLCRALLGAFDPRLVTLLAWALAALLAARLVADPARRLAAVAVVALNPLAYWHQVFGANDVMVVALLLLAALLAERDRATLAGAVLGLACATKQLAWPFAPFLLAHLTGARGFRELLSADARRRVTRPALAAAAVFLAVVAPVAALDFGRFWGDIVVYNVGLPGADNYPLGGTPGFGFANLLIYFGGVSSLKDYFPFGVFYVLLVPLGLLLLRHQVREGRVATVLVTGSAALLASLYFSRVVHPNYLAIAAVLLPLGFLMGERLPADVAAVPLLLLATAVEVAQHELFRTTWEDGLAVRLPQHLGGLASALAPRAGPGLTEDPLGLGLSAIAAGLGVLYLAAGILRASPSLRLALVAAALVALVLAPTLVVVDVAKATGQARAQDPWMAPVLEQAHRFAGFERRPVTLQAWSTSFRRDPPAALEAAGGSGAAPGGAVLGWALGRSGSLDPRPLSLLALGLSAFLLWRLAAPEAGPLATGVSLLSPAAAVGLTFGSSDVFLLALVLAAWALARAGRGVAAGFAMGLGIALFPRALFAAPLVFLAAETSAVPVILGTLAGYLVPALLALSLGAGLADVWRAVFHAEVEPGLGFSNLLLYRGADGPLSRVAMSALPIATAVAGFAVASRAGRRISPAAFAAVLILLGLFVTSGSSPHDLVVPSALVLLASLGPDALRPAPTRSS